MSYRRNVLPRARLEPDRLTAAMVGIGMNFAAEAEPDVNIEDTLTFASVEGMENDDLRVLAVLVSWLDEHLRWVNADRLFRVVARHDSARVRAFWSAVARWKSGDRRFARMARIHAGPRVDLPRTGADFLIGRHGEDARFRDGSLRVPANVLRDRPGDVQSSAALARRHRAYRFRVLMGPTYRADMWAVLEADPSLPAAELARRTYGSFATASQVKHDWRLLNAPSENRLAGARSDHPPAL